MYPVRQPRRLLLEALNYKNNMCAQGVWSTDCICCKYWCTSILIKAKSTCSFNINDSSTDDEWNVRIVTSVRVNTRGLAIQPRQDIQIFHRGPGITGNQLPICDSVSPSKQLHLFLPLQRWKVIHSVHTPGLWAVGLERTAYKRDWQRGQQRLPVRALHRQTETTCWWVHEVEFVWDC